MDDQEAEAALLALGDALKWELEDNRDNRYRLDFGNVPKERYIAYASPPLSDEYCGYSVDSKAGKHFLSYQACRFMGFLSRSHSGKVEYAPVKYKTAGAAKLACDLHRATGEWGMALGCRLTWTEELLPGMPPGTALSHLENETDVYYKVTPCRGRQFRRSQNEFYTVAIEHKQLTRSEYHNRKYPTLDVAKAACERHYATDKWDPDDG